MKKKKLPEAKNDQLTPKMKRFCEQYIIDYNATRSYLAAYPGVKSNKVAGVCGCRLLTFARIQAFISDLERDLGRTIGVSPAKIALEYKKLAFSSVSDIYTTWITRKQFEDLTPDQKACIAEISTQTRTVYEYDPDSDGKKPVEVEYVKIKLHDKQKALEAITKVLGYEAPQKIEHSGEIKSAARVLTPKEIKELYKELNDEGPNSRY